MKLSSPFLLPCFLILSMFSCKNSIPVMETGSQIPMPQQWIDKDTHHKIVRLTDTTSSSKSFYFHNNPFITGPEWHGDYMVYYGNLPKNTDDKDFSPRGNAQLFVLDLKTLTTQQITRHPSRIHGEIVARQGKKVYYQSSDSVFCTDIFSQKTRLVYVFPDSLRGGITTLNANETLLGGVISSKEKMEILRKYPQKGDFFNRIYEAKIPHTLITIDVETGKMHKLFSDTAWLNHVQFSPTDPDLMMFCHEGPWHKVDRIWTINLNDTMPRVMHKRTVYREIAGHEFFSPDGQQIWYDLQIPRGETFYLAGVNVKTGERTRYAMQRDEWSIHFNVSPDQQLFAGDGGDSSQVAHAKDGQWIYLFTPSGDSLQSEKLVNMQHHDYDLEPNVHFSPDGKWIIFRANFEGKSQIYAVEI